MNVAPIKEKTMRNNAKLQSATEYLITYGLALLVVAVVAVVIYSHFALPQAAPSSCVFSSYVTCKQVTIGSNSAGTQAVVLLSNSQSYSIESPSLTLNSSLTGLISSSCTPSFVLPGGLIECIFSSSKKLSINQLTSGNLYFTTTVCSGGTNGLCNAPLQQTYAGAFSTHITPTTNPSCSIAFIDASSLHKNSRGTYYYTVAFQLSLSGYKVGGGTLYLTTNSAQTTFSPKYVNTDNYGYAVSNLNNPTSNSVLLTASFGSCTASNTLSPALPTEITFKTNQSNIAANTLLLNDVWYQTLPVTIRASKSLPVLYDYNSSISLPSGAKYSYNSISGCGATSESGSLSPASNCTVTANYITQAYLTIVSSPSGAGTLTPSSGWYNLNTYTINAISNSGYTFNSWIGTGTGSYSGASGTSTVALGSNAITETATFNQQSGTYTVTLQSNPSGTGTLTGGGSYATGTHVTITASNSLSACYTFTGWTGSGAGSYTGSSSSNVLTIGTANIVETASFSIIQVSITGATDPGSNTVKYSTYSYLTGNSNTGSPNATNAFNCGSSVTLDYEGSGTGGQFTFAAWNGVGPGSYSGTNPSYIFTSLSSSITETADFAETGGGGVPGSSGACNSSPGGNCPGICVNGVCLLGY